MRPPRPVVCLANGNFQGRLIRLVADAIHSRRARPIHVVSSTRMDPLHSWPEERASPHRVEAHAVDWAEAEHLVQTAAVFVIAPFWVDTPRRLAGVARRAGTPVVCVVGDLGYGEGRLGPADASECPDAICAPDPITRELLIRHGFDASLIHETGSPYFDTLLEAAALPPPPIGGLRVGVLANPNGLRQERRSRERFVPEGVVPAVDRVLAGYPGSRMTVRLHPRQDPTLVAQQFDLPGSASFDPLPPISTFAEFVAAHHAIVGSYSSGLMVARLLGRPAISFQPPMGDEGLRREVFAAWDIPVVTDDASLAACLAERLQSPGRPLDPHGLLYHPGRSLDAISTVILEASVP